jgi:hypothetical protein
MERMLGSGMRLNLLLCCAALAAPTTIAAADGATDLELRVLGGSYPGYRDVTYGSTPDEQLRLGLDDHRGGAIEIQAIGFFNDGEPVQPWVLGGWAFRFTDARDPQHHNHAVSTGAFELGVGMAVRPWRWLRLEVGVVGAGGRAYVSDDGVVTSGGASDGATYLGADARAGLWLVSRRVSAGVVVGSAAHMVDCTFTGSSDHPGPTVDSGYEGYGNFVLVGLGFPIR